MDSDEAEVDVPVRCRGLTVAYGDHVAARDVSFDVGRGEIFGLLGPNGAGKTSVIRALTTILDPSSGTATIGGADLARPMEVRRAIGVLPESNGYPDSLTGHAYLRFYGELFGLSRTVADERADRLLAKLGLGDVTGRIATYSRGMRQRLGLCRTLINDPAVLFLDEPTLGLDPAGKDEVVSHLADLAVTEDKAVLLCTHLLDEVERVCDRVAILDHGEIIVAGTVDEVIAAAALGGFARIRLASPGDIAAAQQALGRTDVVTGIGLDNARPGELDLTLSGQSARPGIELLGALAAADIEVRSFERNRGSLNDAFLALTATSGSRQEVAA